MTLKTDWGIDDTVLPDDFNNISKGINENKNDILLVQNELKKSDNNKYITENGIKEFESKNGYVDNICIEGETLVNLAINYDYQVNHEGTAFVSFFSEFSGLHYNRISDGQFTLINYCDKELVFEMSDIGGYENYEEIRLSPNESKVLNITSDRRIYSYFGTKAQFETMENFKKSSKVIVIKGDHTNKQIQYFEGLKSVGQGDKIEVLTLNNKSDNIFNSWGTGALDEKTGTEVDNPVAVRTDFIPVFNNSSYMINKDVYVFLYDDSKQFVKSLNVINAFNQINTENCKYIRLFRHYSELEDTQVFSFTKYDKKQILTTLRSLPNGVNDEIIKIGNSYKKIERCGEVVVNGVGEIITGVFNISGVNTLSQFNLDFSRHLNQANTTSMYCDKFKVVLNGITECVFLNYVNNEKELIFRIDKSKLTSQDLDGFKKWLKDNPVTMVYQLETPNIIDLPNFNPQTFTPKTTLLLNSSIVQGECKFEVTNSLGSSLESMSNIINVLQNVSSDTEQYKNMLKDLGYGSNIFCRNADVLNYTNGIFITGGETIGASAPGLLIHQSWDINYAFQIWHKHDTGMFIRDKKVDWKEWKKVQAENRVRLWEGSIASTSGDLICSDTLIGKYSYFIIGIGNVSGGYFKSYIMYPFAYLKENIRQGDEWFIPIEYQNSNYRLYMKPHDNNPNTLYFEFRNYNNSWIGSSNPDTKTFVIRYIIGVR